jgi:hypothetical protein
MSREQKDSSAPFWCSILLAAAVAYPASLGPRVYASRRFELPAPFVAAADVFYKPVSVVIDVVPERIGGWYIMYLYWWTALSGNPIRC